MANITAKRTGELLKGLFAVLDQAPEGLQAGEAMKYLSKSIALTQWEQERYPSGVPHFDKVIRFASMRCEKAGWMTKAEGIWTLTDAGRKAMTDYPDAYVFYSKARAIWGQGSKEMEDVEAEADKSAGVTYEQAREEAWGKIEQHLHSMPPFDFQDLVAAC